MRNAFCAALVGAHAADPFVFLTGDLGFMALEPLQQAMGERFINAGIAEQNMIGVAAGVASTGEQCWCYSIAPFIFARPFEQIRNDVCLHDANVKLVANGGGYGYGVMGATHHAIEDYGVMCTLQNMQVHVPAFAADLSPIVGILAQNPHPAYLRLGRDELPKDYKVPPYAPWRRLLDGDAGVLIVIGPGVGGILAHALSLSVSERPEIWIVTELPLQVETIPAECLEALKHAKVVALQEEHVAQGGAGQMLALILLEAGIHPRRFRHFHAKGYPSGRYGSQTFHRLENGLDPASVLTDIAQYVQA